MELKLKDLLIILLALLGLVVSASAHKDYVSTIMTTTAHEIESIYFIIYSG